MQSASIDIRIYSVANDVLRAIWILKVKCAIYIKLYYYYYILIFILFANSVKVKNKELNRKFGIGLCSIHVFKKIFPQVLHSFCNVSSYNLWFYIYIYIYRAQKNTFNVVVEIRPCILKCIDRVWYIDSRGQLKFLVKNI